MKKLIPLFFFVLLGGCQEPDLINSGKKFNSSADTNKNGSVSYDEIVREYNSHIEKKRHDSDEIMLIMWKSMSESEMKIWLQHAVVEKKDVDKFVDLFLVKNKK